jgi:tight adherence protein B
VIAAMAVLAPPPPAAAAFAAGALLALAVAELARGAPGRARDGGLHGARALAQALDAAVRLGREGRAPGAAERRQLLLAASAMLLVLGWLVAGARLGLLVAAAGPWLGARLLRLRRERYRRAVAQAAPQLAAALADALSGGHSLRAALAEAGRELAGPAGIELRRVGAELALGATTDAALQALRDRAMAPAIDAIAAACLLQRRAGGDLAALLRELSTAFEDEARLAGEVRTATAQARFTGGIVALLPLGGALLAELASPGFLAGLLGDPLSASLVMTAGVLQLVAAIWIRRLGRVRW